MRYERLSKQEQMLFEVFQEVNAMTYEQVKQFLMKFTGCSENVPKYIVHNLIRKEQYLRHKKTKRGSCFAAITVIRTFKPQGMMSCSQCTIC